MTISRNLSILAEGVSSTGVLGATYGGTGQSSITTGDLLYGSASNTISKLAIGSTGTILRVVGGVPAWGTDYTGTVTSVAASVPSFLSISGSPITTSGTLAITYSGTALPTANGGTALTSFTANGVLYASSSSVLATSSNLQFNGTALGVGGSNGFAQELNVIVPVYAASASGGWRIGDSGNNYYTDYLFKTDASANPYIQTSVATHITSQYWYGGGNNYWRWFTNNTEAMRLDSSQNFMVGQTAAGNNNSNGFWQSPASGAGYFGQNHVNGTTSGTAYAYFAYNGTAIGTITQSGTTGVLYNITSDRRLKSNIASLSSDVSGTIIDALLPRIFTWNADGSSSMGFITDEYQKQFPNAIVGDPNSVDEDGNPIYQQGDFSTSEFMAVLVAEMQSLRARLKAANIA